MALFKVKFAWNPSDPEGAVVIANDIEEAKELVAKDVDDDNITWVDGEFPSDEVRKWNLYGKIERVRENKLGVVYRGNYCC